MVESFRMEASLDRSPIKVTEAGILAPKFFIRLSCGVAVALILVSMSAYGTCAPVPARMSPTEAEVQSPVLVVASPTAARQVSEAFQGDEPLLGAIFEVRLEVRQVLAGAPEGSMESDIVTVRLAASNSGYFRPGAEFLVLLDPRLMARSEPLYWRRFTRFACVESSEVQGSGLHIEDPAQIVVGRDVCLPYGP